MNEYYYYFSISKLERGPKNAGISFNLFLYK